MTVLITMAGVGSRFRKSGYTVPKYRITARGRTLMDWALLSMQAFFGERFIFACLEEDSAWILASASALGITEAVIARRSSLSRGQAETAFDALAEADPAESLWIYNIDTHVTPMAMKPQDLDEALGCLHVFHSTEPNMSFVRYGAGGDVLEVAEKRAISTWATVGMYGFRSAASFGDLYIESYEAGRVPNVKGERYIAPMYELLLERGERVVAPQLQSADVYILGTPDQVKQFDATALPPSGSPITSR